MREIIVENAYENNLKNVSLRIPQYKLIVVTGVSGSGMVGNMLFAEGQHLYCENFNFGRHTSAKLSHPRISRIGGLFSLISIDQISMD